MKSMKKHLVQTLRTSLSVLMSLFMLISTLQPLSALAETEYYNADGAVVVAPIPVPTEEAPAGTVAGSEDGISFAFTPADSALAMASLSVERVTDSSVMDAVRSTYSEVLNADVSETELRVYQLRLSVDGAQVSPPADWTLDISAPRNIGFTPVKALSLRVQGNDATLGVVSGIDVTSDQWATNVTLSNTDMVLLAGSTAAADEPTATEAPTLAPNEFSFEDGDIRLTAAVTGALPPAGAELYVNRIDNAAPPTSANGEALTTLLAYQVGFRTSEGLLTSNMPLSVQMELKQQGTVQAARSLTDGSGNLLWSLSDGASQNTAASFAFSLPVGGAFVLAGVTEAAPEATPVTQPYTYEDENISLTATVTGDQPPEGAVFTVTPTEAEAPDGSRVLLAYRVGFTDDQGALTTATPLELLLTVKNADALAAAQTLWDDQGNVLWVAAATDAETTGDAQPTTAPAQEAFAFPLSAGGAFLFSGAVETATASFVYEDDAVRLTVTPAEGQTLAQGAQMDAAVFDSDWATYGYHLESAGYDQSRVQRLMGFTTAFTLEGETLDVSAVPMRYELLLKGAAYEGDVPLVMDPDSVSSPETFTQTEEGALATFTSTGEPTIGFAVVLPGRTVYTYEDDDLYVVATLSDPSAIPEGATFEVIPVEVTEEMQASLDAVLQPEATEAPTDETIVPTQEADTASTQGDTSSTDTQGDTSSTDTQTDAADDGAAQVEPEPTPVTRIVYTAYDVHFLVDGQEYEPQSGTVNVTLRYKQKTEGQQRALNVNVMHFTQDGQTPVELPSSFETDDEQALETVTFDTDSFSFIVTAVTQSVETNTSTVTITNITSASQTFTNTAYYLTRPLGIAGNFHIVAFNRATLNTHTNGNILAQYLDANVNFGTNGLTDELSYIQKYEDVAQTSAASQKHVLALGSYNTVALKDPNDPNTNYTDRFFLTYNSNTEYITCPKNVYWDQNTASLPFINLSDVKTSVSSISSSLAGYAQQNVTTDYTSSNNKNITLTQSGGVGIANMSGSTMNTIAASSTPLYIYGLTASSGTVIINVDCGSASALTIPETIIKYSDGSQASMSETTSFGTSRVLWNFRNCSGTTLTTKDIKGSILAVGATVNAAGAVNGTIIAENVIINKESHRDDFLGSLYPSMKVTAQKVWKNSSGTVITAPTGATVTVQLYKTKNGTTTAVGSAVTLSSSNSWTNDWSGLDFGYTYSVTETAINGVTISDTAGLPSASGYSVYYENNALTENGTITIYNRQVPTTSVTVTKTWAGDTGYESTYRTSPLTLLLQRKLADGTTVDSTFSQNVQVTGGSSSSTWSTTVSSLPAGYYTQSGSTITYNTYTYFVTEPTANVPKGYVMTQNGNYGVINTLQTLKVRVNKTWLDDANGDGTYETPASHPAITVTVWNGTTSVATGTISATETTWISGALPKYTTSGALITYTVTESGAEAYTLTGPTYSSTTESSVEVRVAALTNTYQRISIPVTKTWDMKGTTETKPAVTYNLYDHASPLATDTPVATKTVAAGGTYNVTFTSLPKYNSSGTEITYGLLEVVNGAYNTPVITGNNSGFTVANTLKTTSVSGAKTWLDAQGNTYTGYRPAITVQLMRKLSGAADSTATVYKTQGFAAVAAGTSATYSYSFTDLPYAAPDGTAYVYTVAELSVSGFTTTRTAGTNDLVNKVETTTVTVTKTWSGDSAYAATYRPTSLNLTIRRQLAGGAVDSSWSQAITVSADSWTATSGLLPAGYYSLDSGTTYTYHQYTYYVTEDNAPGGYTPDDNQDLSVTNTLQTVKVRVNKTWQDDANGDGTYETPASHPAITVTVWNGATSVATGTISATETTWISGALPKYTTSGALITYTVTESGAEAYTLTGPTYSSTTESGVEVRVAALTNTYQRISIPVTKTWDMKGTTETKPAVTYNLYDHASPLATDTPVATKTVAAGGTYNVTFTSLPKYNSSGTEITYGLLEVVNGAYNTPVITGNNSGFTVANTLKTTSVSGAKTWLDAQGNAYTGYRPAITVQLMRKLSGAADSTATVYKTQGFAAVAAGTSATYSYSFTNLPQYAPDGTAYVYSVAELTVSGFTTTRTAGTNDLVNTVTAVNIPVTKQWNNNGFTGTVTQPPITVSLYNGVDAAAVTTYEFPANATSYQHTFGPYPAGYYDASGSYHVYAYTVAETVPDGYTSVAPTGNQTDGYTIVNQLRTTQLTVTKTWAGEATYTEAYRPSSLTLTIHRKLADGSTDADWSQAITVQPDSWTATSGQLPLGYYAQSGSTYTYHAYDYFVTEDSVPNGYAAVQTDDLSVTNTLQTVKVRVNKIWQDDANGDGTYETPATHPAMEVYVWNGGEKVATGTISATETTWISDPLPKYTTGGTLITYTVTEKPVPGYATGDPAYSDITESNVEVRLATLTNTYQRIDIPVTKTWDMKGTTETKPAVTYNLYNHANPLTTDTRVAYIEVVAGGTYDVTFENLPKYNSSGTEITYGLLEVVNGAYNTPVITGNNSGFTVANTLKTTSVSGVKTWVDTQDNAYTGYRPAIDVQLMRKLSGAADSTATVYKTQHFDAVAAGASATYSYSFTDLPYAAPDGTAYAYYIAEPNVPGFTTTLTGNDLTNTFDTSMSVKVTKAWDNNGYAYATALVRPSVTVYLLNGADHNTVSDPAASFQFASGTTNYTHTFENLPVGYFDGSGVYHAYEYSATEGAANGYTLVGVTGNATDGFTITNKLVKVSVSVVKSWILGSGVTTVPAITVTLIRDGTETIDTKTIDAGAPDRAAYSWTWENLPAKNPATGNDYDYTVQETIDGAAANGYTGTSTTVRGTDGNFAATLTNTQKKTVLQGTKTWQDQLGNTAPAGSYHPAFTVTLYQGNSVYTNKTPITFAANETSLDYSFTDLPMYSPEGALYEYSVKESAVTGYTTAYGEVTRNGAGTLLTANIINRLNATELTVNKQWMDNGVDVTATADRAVTVQLVRHTDAQPDNVNVEGQTATLSPSNTPNAYQVKFSDLPAGVVDASGVYHPYTYSVTEAAITGWNTVIGTTDVSSPLSQTMTVTNSRGRITYTVTKRWLNADGGTLSAPANATVTLALYSSVNNATPAPTGQTLTLNGIADGTSTTAPYESAAWVATFPGLEQFDENDQLITYSAVETASTLADTFYPVAHSVSGTAYRIDNTQTRIKVTKTSDVTGAALTGAAFTLTTEGDPLETYTLAGSSLTSDWTQVGLAVDTVYVLSETTTPQGYLTAPDVRFLIDGDNGDVYTLNGSTQTLCVDHTIPVVNQTIDLKVVKLDVQTTDSTVTSAQLSGEYADHFVVGAKLALYAQEDQTTALQTIPAGTGTLTEAGVVYTLNYDALVKGKTYVLKEITTPAGYRTAAPLVFTVGTAGNGTIYALCDQPIEYKPAKVLKTWDSGSAPADVTFSLYMGTGTAKTLLETLTITAASQTAGTVTVATFPGTGSTLAQSLSVNGKYPVTDQNGTAIVYTVEEAAVDGYYVTQAMHATTATDAFTFAITNTPVVVSFTKTDLTGDAEVPGAHLTLTDITGGANTPVEDWTSGTTPHEITGKLIVGHTYTLTETSAPGGYGYVESVSFTVQPDGTIVAVGTTPEHTEVSSTGGNVVHMSDKALTLTVSKKAATGQNELPGATLTLTDTDANLTVASWIGTSTAMVFGSTISTTGTGTPIDGWYYTFVNAEQEYPLIAGHHYTLTETAAPAGYLLANTITFTIAADGTITDVSVPTAKDGTVLTLRDELNSLIIRKAGNDTAALLPGATFALYLYSGNETSPLGNRVLESETITTGADGTYTLHGLTNNTAYVLVETAAPQGYSVAAPVVFTYYDDDQPNKTVSVTVTDTRATFRLRKVDEAGNPLAGASLAIYNADQSAAVWTGTSAANSTDTPDGWITLSADTTQTDASQYLVKGGTYYLRETQPPQGYALPALNGVANNVPFTFGTDAELQLTNAKLSLTISKQDIVGSGEIPGAHLTLTDNNTNAAVDDWWTAQNSEGKVLPREIDFALLTAGHTYTLTEETAPDGYVVAESVQFKVNNDGTITLLSGGSLIGHTVIMTDDRTGVTITKTGMDDTVLTSGVSFTLYQSDINGTQGAVAGTAGTGFSRLVDGQYYLLVETAVPSGYTTMAPLLFQFHYSQATGATSLTFDARADVTVNTAANGKVTLTIKDAPTSVTVAKVDENGDPLSGATLAIYPDDGGKPGATAVAGTTFTTTDAQPTATFSGLLVKGTDYWLVEESAPENYALAAPISFTVGDSATTQTLTMENLPLEVSLYKLDSDLTDAVTGEYTGNKVSGVTLTLTGPYQSGSTYEAVHTWTWNTKNDNPNMLTMADGLVPGGKYTLTEDETTVPDTNLYAAPLEFTLPANGGTVSYVMVDAPVGSVSVTVTKAFDNGLNGTALTDAELPASVTVNLMRGLLADGSDGQKVGSFVLTKGGNWTHTFSGLLKTDGDGNPYVYTVTEDQISGFALRLTEPDADAGDNYSYTLHNKAYEGEFSKRDIAGDELPGASMQLLDSAGNVIASWISTDQPYVLRGKLNPNTDYVLKETAAPDGYLVTTQFTFHMDNDMHATVGTVTYGGVDDSNIVYMVDAATTVTFSKKIAGGGAELAGATLILTDTTPYTGQPADEITRTWVSDGTDKTLTAELIVGHVYTLTEQTSPHGYLVAETIQFVIQPDGSVKAKKLSEDDTAYVTVTNNTVLMEDKPTEVTFSKKEIVNGPELPGAVLTLTDTTPDATETPAEITRTWTSGNTATTLTGALIVGHVYTLTEETAPHGYTVTESIQFVIQPDGTVKAKKLGADDSTYATVTDNTVLMLDAPTEVSFSKQALGLGAELPNAFLTLTDLTPAAGQTTTEWSWESTTVEHVITGELIGGHTYELTETTAPAGYHVSESVTFTIDENGAISAVDASGNPVDNGNGTVTDGAKPTVTMKDAPTVLSITKVDDQTPAKAVPGAELSIYTATETATVPGTFVTKVTTDASGLADVSGVLSVGAWYMIVETVTPDGNVTAPVYGPFQMQATSPTTVTMVDNRTVFRVAKRDARTNAMIAGATLVIYDSMVVNGETVPDTTSAPIATIQTVDGASTPLYGLLRNHTYFLYEAVAPDGYLRNMDLYTPFTISEDGATEVYSDDMPTHVALNKVNGDSDRIAGATLVLVRGDGASYDPATDVVDSWISADNANHDVYNLLIGQTYTLLETAAPTGYVLNTTGKSFKLNESGYVIDASQPVSTASTVSLVSLVNSPVNVTFSKQATGAGTAELPGATLSITHMEGGVLVTDDQWVSGDANNRDSAGNPIPREVTTGLKADGITEYTFTEIGAPDGYTIAGSLVFRIETDGTVSIRQSDGSWKPATGNEVVMTDAPIRFKVSKVDNVTGNPLAGAHLKIVPDVSGAPGSTAVTGYADIVSETTPVTVSGLPAGSYWLVETKAPTATDINGNPVYYQLAAPVAFTVTDDLLAESNWVTVTVRDQPTTVTILKLDSDAVDENGFLTGNRVPNATLTLTRKGSNVVLSTYTSDGVQDWVIDDGLLEPGATYVIYESVENTPDGYLAAYRIEFTVADDGNDRWIVVDDPIAVRDITVNKVWNDTASTHPTITVELYRSDDPSTAIDSRTIVSPDTSATFTALPLQAKDHSVYTYSVVEKTVDQYLPGAMTGPVTSADGSTDTYTVTNTPTRLTISKMAADTGNELAGASLALMTGSDPTYDVSRVVDEWISGTDGTDASGHYKPHDITGLVTVGQTYTLIERAAPDGYLTADPITFTYLAGGTTTYSGTGTVTMADQPVSVQFAKVDNLTGLYQAGASFALYDDADWQADAASAVPIFTFVSKTTPVPYVGKLTAGKLYRLVETAAPSGYLINASSLQFSAPTTSITKTVTMSDPLLYYFAKISSTTGSAVSGATLKVTDLAGNTVIAPWVSGTTPHEFANADTTTGEAILKVGVTYRLVEVSAPSGYELNTAGVSFQLSANGLINGGVTVTMRNTPETPPVDETVDLYLRKTWVDNSNSGNTRPTAGLSVTLYRKLATETTYAVLTTLTIPYRNANTWYLTIRDMPRYNDNGVEYNYRVREVVPTGYTVTYTNNGLTMVNTYPTNDESPTPTPIPTLTPTPSPTTTTRIPTNVKYIDGEWVYIDDYGVPLGVVPQTGDETNYLLWGAAIVLPLLLAVFAAWMLLRRKRRDAEAHAQS